MVSELVLAKRNKSIIIMVYCYSTNISEGGSGIKHVVI